MRSTTAQMELWTTLILQVHLPQHILKTVQAMRGLAQASDHLHFNPNRIICQEEV